MFKRAESSSNQKQYLGCPTSLEQKYTHRGITK
jgi:hypothetical protein